MIHQLLKKGHRSEKTSRIQIAREIIEQVKREMQEPRLMESVRNSICTKPLPGASEGAAPRERA